MKSVSSRSMIRCFRTTPSARSRPGPVSSASFRSPRSISPSASRRLSALATGILLFLLWDVLSGAVSPIEHRLEVRHWGPFAGYAALGVGGFVLGLMSLVYYAEWMKTRANRRATTLVGPGAAATDEFRQRGSIEALTPGMRLALLIAVGIGVHNFAEGLA